MRWITPSSEKKSANSRKRLSKPIVQQPGAQSYTSFLAGIKERIRTAQVKAELVDLKVVDFQPEFAGKMSFYQAAVDNQVKTVKDGATIGIILCRGKNQTVVDYPVRDAKSPIGVAEYQLLPPKLKAELPETKELKKLLAQTKPWRRKAAW